MECLVDARCQVGESPVWDAQQGRLFWVDVLARTVFALDTGSGQLRRWTFEGPVGSLGLTRTGRLVVAIGLGIYLFDLRTEALSLLVSLDDEPKTNRVNDGKVGPDGAFWIGTMDGRPVKEAVAALYRVTADGKAERKIAGLVVSNGLAWSADAQMMVHSDSRACWIDRWIFAPGTGHISGGPACGRSPTKKDGRTAQQRTATVPIGAQGSRPAVSTACRWMALFSTAYRCRSLSQPCPVSEARTCGRCS